MQQIAYVVIGNTRIRILVRKSKFGVYAKMADGKIQPNDKFMEDESMFLSLPENYQLVQRLHEGKTILL
jgi:hypothetical protein